MACLTAMTLQEGHALVARYGLRLVELEAVQHGSVNSNFRLTLHDGQRLFARVCEESVASEVEAQNALLQHLVLGGVPTPAPLAMEGGVTVAEHAGKPRFRKVGLRTGRRPVSRRTDCKIGGRIRPVRGAAPRPRKASLLV